MGRPSAEDALAVTRRTLVRAHLEADEYLAAIITSSADAIISKNLHGVITSWNQGAEHIFGYAADEMIGRSILQLIPPDRAEEETAIMARLQRGERIEPFETMRLRKDGREVPVSLAISPIKDRHGKIIGASKIARDITEQKREHDRLVQTEEELREFSFILNQAGWAVATINSATNRIGFCNAAFAQMHGRSVEEMTGMPFIETLAPEWRAQWPDHFARVGRGGDYAYESLHVRKDGTVFPVRTRATTFNDEHGRPRFRASVFEDITELKRAEDARRRSERELEDFFENAVHGLHLVGPDGTILRANRAELALLGYSPEEYIGRNIADFHADQAVIQDILARLTRGEKLVDYPAQLRAKDGSLRHVNISSSVRWECGEFVHTRCFTLDVTERRRAEDQVRSQLQRLQLLSDAARHLLEAGNPLDLIDRIFDGLATAFGLDFYFHFAVEPPGRGLRLRASRGIAPEIARQIETLEFGQAVCGTVARDLQAMVIADVQRSTEPFTEFIRGLGITAYACHPMIANGRLLGTLSFGTHRHREFTPDVVESIRALTDMASTAIARRNAEDALAQAHAQLERHAADLEGAVRERTAKLEEAVSDLETFSYTVSHDLRSPLRSMQGFAHLVLTDYADKLDAQARDYLQRIDRAAERMDTLIMEVLAYNRSGRVPPQREPIGLETLLADIMRPQAAFHAPAADVSILGPLPSVLGHRPALEQAVTQLLHNATKFVLPGATPRIEISAREEDGKVRLSIKDHGIGIPESAQKHVFKAFHRAHPAGGYAGTGIGLAIVKRSIERQGGSVGMRSTPEAGSVFWIELPAARKPAPPPP